MRYCMPNRSRKTAKPTKQKPQNNAAIRTSQRSMRQNITMRMGIRRYTRLTNGFSKKIANHEAATALHFMHYNFCRIHKTLRVTPAMQAGIADRVWSLEDLARLAG